MYKINGKDGTITLFDSRAIIISKVTIPLWTIKSYKVIRIPNWRKWFNWIFSFGYVLVTVVILWYMQKTPVSWKLFVGTYIVGFIMTLIKRFDDKRLVNVNYQEGRKHIVIYTEWGEYLVDCEDKCDKLTTFLDVYLSDEENEKEITEESTESRTSGTLSPVPVPGSQ